MRISCSNTDIQTAVKTINNGGIVIFPTDTVYGIGCDPYNTKAVQLLYEIKKRSTTKPFPIIGYSKKEIEKIAEFNRLEEKITEKFWPGPITLVLKVKDKNLSKLLIPSQSKSSSFKPKKSAGSPSKDVAYLF